MSSDYWRTMRFLAVFWVALLPLIAGMAWVATLGNPTGEVARIGVGRFVVSAAITEAALWLFSAVLFALIERAMTRRQL